MVRPSADRRARILRAAERLLHARGPVDTTIQDIAREARVAVGSVYLEFDGKDAIVEAVSSGRHVRVLRAMMDASTLPGLDYAVRLRRTLEARAEAFLSARAEGSRAAELIACTCPGVRAAHRRFADDEEVLLARLLRDAHAAGEFQVPDPALAARALLRAHQAFSPPALFDHPPAVIRRQQRVLHDLLLDGLVRRRNHRG